MFYLHHSEEEGRFARRFPYGTLDDAVRQATRDAERGFPVDNICDDDGDEIMSADELAAQVKESRRAVLLAEAERLQKEADEL